MGGGTCVCGDGGGSTRVCRCGGVRAYGRGRWDEEAFRRWKWLVGEARVGGAGVCGGGGGACVRVGAGGGSRFLSRFSRLAVWRAEAVVGGGGGGWEASPAERAASGARTSRTAGRRLGLCAAGCPPAPPPRQRQVVRQQAPQGKQAFLLQDTVPVPLTSAPPTTRGGLSRGKNVPPPAGACCSRTRTVKIRSPSSATRQLGSICRS